MEDPIAMLDQSLPIHEQIGRGARITTQIRIITERFPAMPAKCGP